jgi:hypothetical protein
VGTGKERKRPKQTKHGVFYQVTSYTSPLAVTIAVTVIIIIISGSSFPSSKSPAAVGT